MARRNRKSDLEVWIEIASRLPWWLGVLLAVVSYLAFHSVAGIQIEAPKGMQGLGNNISMQMFRVAGMFLQYLAPLVFIVGAISSAIGRARRQRLLAETQQRGGTSALLNLSWQDFERLVGEVFRQRGFAVAENAGPGADGGVDLTLTKGREKFLVQCKRWKATMVGVDVVRELFGVMAARGATGGFVVCTGQFSPDAKAFAEGRNIDLIGSSELLAALAKQPSNQRSIPSAGANVQCPQCGGTMVKRVAKQGPRAGQSFWGCSKYPACKGTLSAS